MRHTSTTPPKSDARVCQLCGLKGYAPIVVECAQLKYETTRRVQCANAVACARRVRLAERQQQRAAGG